MTDKRAFLQWFALLLSYIAAAFFAAYYGLLEAIWKTDVTFMTSAIAAAFVVSVLYLGWASWRFDRTIHRERFQKAVADVGVGHNASDVVMRIGLLGTVIGLSLQAQAMGNINFTDPANLLGFIKIVALALGSAFFATGCGIVGSIGINIMTANLNYFIDHNEVE